MNQKFNLKGNNFIKNMLRYSYLIIVSLLLNAAVNGIIVSANRIISVNIDHMLAGEAVDISTVIIKFIYLTLSGFVLSFAGSRLSLKYAVRVINSYRKQISSKLYRIDYSYYDNAGTATIINKVNSDIAEAENFLTEHFAQDSSHFFSPRMPIAHDCYHTQEVSPACMMMVSSCQQALFSTSLRFRSSIPLYRPVVFWILHSAIY